MARRDTPVTLDFGDVSAFTNQSLSGTPPLSQPSNESKTPASSSSIFSVEYYSFLFNVNSSDVRTRILKSLVPFPATFFSVLTKNPDLYGPFWISSSLILTLAVAGNVAKYFSSDEQTTADVDVAKLSLAASTIYGYLAFVPVLLFWVLKYVLSKPMPFSLFELICLFGYSLSVFIPVAILCVIPTLWLRWLLTLLGGACSTSFVFFNCSDILKEERAKSLPILIVTGVVHMGFAIVCQLYFF